jgi:hypothetical protein
MHSTSYVGLDVHKTTIAVAVADGVVREKFGNWAPLSIVPMCCARWTSDLSDEGGS